MAVAGWRIARRGMVAGGREERRKGEEKHQGSIGGRREKGGVRQAGKRGGGKEAFRRVVGRRLTKRRSRSVAEAVADPDCVLCVAASQYWRLRTFCRSHPS
ncbi:hypothetical protein E2C01_040699 [Portunus trituberculatus]|uniref:Uncharacterized protein n=1 Tax=Portunus trituberculatus TaxID=210409 RepID=A0A5B7FPX0_PORTR|nr:hypothetical protein [Portunus trituberculatus]